MLEALSKILIRHFTLETLLFEERVLSRAGHHQLAVSIANGVLLYHGTRWYPSQLTSDMLGFVRMPDGSHDINSPLLTVGLCLRARAVEPLVNSLAALAIVLLELALAVRIAGWELWEKMDLQAFKDQTSLYPQVAAQWPDCLGDEAGKDYILTGSALVFAGGREGVLSIANFEVRTLSGQRAGAASAQLHGIWLRAKTVGLHSSY